MGKRRGSERNGAVQPASLGSILSRGGRKRLLDTTRARLGGLLSLGNVGPSDPGVGSRSLNRLAFLSATESRRQRPALYEDQSLLGRGTAAATRALAPLLMPI
jgi:hypothetical protein